MKWRNTISLVSSAEKAGQLHVKKRREIKTFPHTTYKNKFKKQLKS